jgi:hypothetical protein
VVDLMVGLVELVAVEERILLERQIQVVAAEAE